MNNSVQINIFKVEIENKYYDKIVFLKFKFVQEEESEEKGTAWHDTWDTQ